MDERSLVKKFLIKRLRSGMFLHWLKIITQNHHRVEFEIHGLLRQTFENEISINKVATSGWGESL
jgi:hypothetical protein